MGKVSYFGLELFFNIASKRGKLRQTGVSTSQVTCIMALTEIQNNTSDCIARMWGDFIPVPLHTSDSGWRNSTDNSVILTYRFGAKFAPVCHPICHSTRERHRKRNGSYFLHFWIIMLFIDGLTTQRVFCHDYSSHCRYRYYWVPLHQAFVTNQTFSHVRI